MGESYAYSNNGVDTVEFIAATNPGEPLKPLAKIASTGEISRFALALKSALAGADNIPVLIFDEIDIGVGGRSGEVIGKKLWNLAPESPGDLRYSPSSDSCLCRCSLQCS